MIITNLGNVMHGLVTLSDYYYYSTNNSGDGDSDRDRDEEYQQQEQQLVVDETFLDVLKTLRQNPPVLNFMCKKMDNII